MRSPGSTFPMRGQSTVRAVIVDLEIGPTVRVPILHGSSNRRGPRLAKLSVLTPLPSFLFLAPNQDAAKNSGLSSAQAGSSQGEGRKLLPRTSVVQSRREGD